MAIDNLPMFTAMNREEVKPPFPPPCKPPMTSQEAHFAIMEKVNACINEVNNFEQRVHFEMDKFMARATTENNGFKEAIQASYNAFMQTVQHEVNNFETDMQNNFDIYRNDVDKRFADFQTAIEKDFATLQDNVISASNGKIQEMENLKISLNQNYASFKANILEIVDNFKTQVNQHMTEQDGKIETYKQYMVDNLPANVEAVFNKKAENGEIAEIMGEVYGGTRTFKGSLSYDEIQAVENPANGDYYYCTSDGHYYQRTETAWVDIGNGEKLADDYETYKINNDVKVNALLNNPVAYNENLLPYHYQSMEYDGVTSNVYLDSRLITLEKGFYRLLIPDTNINRVILTGYDSQFTERIMNEGTPFNKFYDFEITDTYANIPLRFYFYISTSNGTADAGTYYVYHYLFKLDENKNTILDYMVNQESVTLLDDSIVKNLNPIFKKYTGVIYEGIDHPYDQFTLDTLSFPEGNYKLVLINNRGFVGAYISDIENVIGNRLVSQNIKDKNSVEIPFTVNSENANKPFFFNLNRSLAESVGEGFAYCDFVYIFRDYGYPYLPEFITHYEELRESIDEAKALINDLAESVDVKLTVKGGYLMATTENLNSGSSMTIPKIVDVKKNKTLIFTAKTTDFNGLILGHGKSSYGGSYVSIDKTNVEVFSYTTAATSVKQSAHGLTFGDYITVVVTTGTDKADISIMTPTGMFTLNDVSWGGSNGYIFAESVGTTFTECELKWTTADINKGVWVFGDSYLGLTSTSRYPYYILDMGFTNWLASGYAGGVSVAELASFKTLLELGKPKVVVWCMGMNNGDNGAINESWLSCVEEMKTLCETNNIELILSTIPTCPKVDNTYKNEYVRNSGYRYIDFNKAVGVNGTTWYEGMLASDEVHPAELGAKALAHQFIVDVPEITYL